MINRLALKFVNSHCKCKSNWKLATLKFEKEMDVKGNEGDAWNENNFSCMFTTKKANLQNTI
jgi:hypothetical protein